MKGASPLHHESPEGKSARGGGQGCEKMPSETMKVWSVLDTMKHPHGQYQNMLEYQRSEREGSMGAV